MCSLDPAQAPRYPSAVSDPDAPLVCELKEEKPGAFEKLFQRYWRRVLGLALAHLPDTAEAEDCALETFADLARGIKNFRGDSKLSTYIYRVTLNHIKKHRRALARRLPTLPLENCPEDAATTPGPEEELRTQRALEALYNDINRLPETQRQPLILRHILELPLDEVAEILGTSRAVVAMRINRALKKLRRWKHRREKKEARCPMKT